MAVFVVNLIDQSDSDPLKDRFRKKRGDIVSVYEDGFTRSRLLTPDRAWLVRVPGYSVHKARKYMQPHFDALSGEASLRRLYRLRVDDLPSSVLQKLKDKGEITVTLDQVKSYLRNKITGKDEA